MKRFLLILLAVVACTQMQAIPAESVLVKVKQPDGTYVTIRLVGDEFMSFNVTEDGFTVVRNEQGYYVYAQQAADGELLPTSQIAHDEMLREGAEKKFLARTKKFLQPKMTPAMAVKKQREYGLRRQASEVHRAPNYDYTKFRGLVILVEYNDRTFREERYKDIITDMINQENYTGYVNYNNARVSCTGSVYDYFRDNSMGVFKPQFDVIGPVTVDRSQYYAKGTSNSVQLISDVVDVADELVNFADYDGDKDGYVDMIYFIFAGHPSSFTGNNDDLIWPHAYRVYSPGSGRLVRKDGVYLYRYACSTELHGSQTGNSIDGIGTICHEFSHVLGLPDFYDTDYAESGGRSYDPGSWTLMSQGCYLNDSRTPAGYSLFERYIAGFATPEVIEEEGSYTLEKLNASNKGYRINTPVRREYFILENRQRERWDAYLPGHGLLVFRVDSTNSTVWTYNTVNANPEHNYYELVRARGTGVSASADPFPGTGKVSTLNNVTTPANLKTWAGKETKFGLLNIAEKGTVISFDIENTYVLRELKLPETFSVPVGAVQRINVTAVPEYANFKLTWTSADENIATIDQEGNIHGVSEGETTITVESDNGCSASCVLTVEKLPEALDIADFKTFAENEESVLSLENAQVLYVHDRSKNIYVRDASGAIILNQTGLEAKPGNLLSGKLIGKLQYLNNMPRFLPTRTITGITVAEAPDGAEIQPICLKAAELSPKYYANYVRVDTVPLLLDKTFFVLDDAGNRVARLYNVLGINAADISIPKDLTDKRFNIHAIYGTHPSGTDIIEELYFLRSPEEVEWTISGIELSEVAASGSDNSSVYDLQGRKIAVREGLPKGIYIVNGRKIVVP